MIAKIAVSAANFAIDKPYSYRIPQGMGLKPGQRVMVPFGRGNTRTEGVVLGVEEANEEKLKAVERCLDEEPLLNATQLRLAAFLRERYFCTFYDAEIRSDRIHNPPHLTSAQYGRRSTSKEDSCNHSVTERITVSISTYFIYYLFYIMLNRPIICRS